MKSFELTLPPIKIDVQPFVEAARRIAQAMAGLRFLDFNTSSRDELEHIASLIGCESEANDTPVVIVECLMCCTPFDVLHGGCPSCFGEKT